MHLEEFEGLIEESLVPEGISLVTGYLTFKELLGMGCQLQDQLMGLESEDQGQQYHTMGLFPKDQRE